jgi:hypothetical protein
MRTIWENRDDAALQKVDKEHRFLWVITTWYHKVKKAGGDTAEFWEGLRVGIVMGNPWVSQANPYPYPQKPIPMVMGMGFHGYGYGFLWVLWVQKPMCYN